MENSPQNIAWGHTDIFTVHSDRVNGRAQSWRRSVMYLGGYGDPSLISNMTRVERGFSGCVRRFHVNDRLMDMRKARRVGDALYGVDVRMSAAANIIAMATCITRPRTCPCGTVVEWLRSCIATPRGAACSTPDVMRV